MKTRVTSIFFILIPCVTLLITFQCIAQEPAPSISMLLNHAGTDSILITLKFTNNNVLWNCEGVQAAVRYDVIKLCPYQGKYVGPIYAAHFTPNGWTNFSNPFAGADYMLYGEGILSGSGVTISANQQFNLCRMNFQPQSNDNVTSFSFYDNSGASGSTGYLWANDPDMRAFASATGLQTVYYPVELRSFRAHVDGNIIILTWGTESETNNFGFDIERRWARANGEFTSWEKIDFVSGSGTTTRRNEYLTIDYQHHDEGVYQYRLKQIDTDGSYKFSPVAEVSIQMERSGFELYQNYPNPVRNNRTTIPFFIPASLQDAPVTLKVYDFFGREMETLIHSPQTAGLHQVDFFARDFASGIYIYKLITPNATLSRRMYIVK